MWGAKVCYSRVGLQLLFAFFGHVQTLCFVARQGAFSIQFDPRSLSIFSRIPSAHMDAQCMPPQNMRCESRSQLAWITIKVPGILLTSRNAGVEGPQSKSQSTKQECMDKPDTSLATVGSLSVSLFLGSGWYKRAPSSQDSSFETSRI